MSILFKKILKHAFGQAPVKKKPENQVKQDVHPLKKDLEQNYQEIQKIFNLCGDISTRKLEIGTEKPLKAFIVYAQTMTDTKVASQNILGAVLQEVNLNTDNAIEIINERLLTTMSTQIIGDFTQLTTQILKGGVAVFLEGNDQAILCMLSGYERRSIQDSTSEPVVRGPRDGFVEDMKTNLSLIRRRVASSRLKIEYFELGKITHTQIGVCYIEGIVNPQLVKEVKTRLKRINLDSVIGSNTVEELISDQPLSLFPLIQWTERPDKVAASIVEGRIAILTNNTPAVLILPITFITLLQASEDYYNQSVFATFVRLIRFVALNIALLLPALVVSILSFHQEILPDKLFTTIAATTQGLPFPAAYDWTSGEYCGWVSYRTSFDQCGICWPSVSSGRVTYGHSFFRLP